MTNQILYNGEHLQSLIENFSNFGKTENKGVTRLALSQEDLEARDYFGKLCRDLGMDVKVDDLGNMYATFPGLSNDEPPIVIGSHLDSVKKGGRFDGVLGVIAGLEVIRTLVEKEIEPQVPIVIANITNEEGARFEPAMMSSGILSGKFEKLNMVTKEDKQGISFQKALKLIDYEGEKKNRLKEAKVFLELHIEQGPVLEDEQLKIGVVEGVVGMVCYEIEITGVSNHAGTTPMAMRKDALFVATTFINKVREKFNRLDRNLVYTIGRLNLYPNIHTVIPNKVVFTLEARHNCMEVIKQVEEIVEGLPEVLDEKNCDTLVKKLWKRDTVWFDKEVVDLIEQSTKLLNYPYKKMFSGAGHDAQFISTYIPTGMIFVPSVGGKSHCENEYTYLEDCKNGLNVLLETVLTISGECLRY